MLLCGIAGFGIASLLCGLAQSPEMLIAMRFVQGAAAAMLFPVGIAVIGNAFDVQARGRAIGTVYGLGAIGTAIGPFVGGALADALDWRWVFFFNVPFCVTAFVLALRHVQESHDPSAERVDVPGLATIVAGIACVTLAIDRGAAWGWLGWRTLGLAAIGLALLALFVAIERRVRAPLVDLALFRNTPHVTVTLAGGAGNVATCLMLFLATIYLQQVRGLSPLEAGIVFLAPARRDAVSPSRVARCGSRRRTGPGGRWPARAWACSCSCWTRRWCRWRCPPSATTSARRRPSCSGSSTATC